MSDRRRTITLSVNDDFSRQLNHFVQQINAADGAVENMQNTSSRGWRQTAQDLRDLGLAAQTVFGTFKGIMSTVDEFSQLGTTARRNKAALEGLTGSTAEYKAQVDAVIRATRGSVTESEAAAFAYRMQRFGLAENATEMEKFIGTVSAVAAANPQLGGTAEAINQIQLTISNMSYMRLDQLGVSAGVVRERVAELKAETAGLSTEEAFQMALMEQLEEQVASLGTEFIEIGASQERMKARFRGFKEWMGIEVSETLDIAATSAEQLYTILQNMSASEFVVRLATEFNIDTDSKEWKLLEIATGVATLGMSGLDSGEQGEGIVVPIISPDWQERMSISGYSRGDTPQSIIPEGPTLAGADAWERWGSTVGIAIGKELAGEAALNEMPVASPMWGMSVIPGGDMMNYAPPQLPQLPSPELMGGALGFLGMPEGMMNAPDRGMAGTTRGMAFDFLRDLPGQLAESETMASSTLDAIAEGFGFVTTKAGEAANAVGVFAEGAEKFGSLAEKFGISAENFDVEVGREMQRALSDAGVGADEAAAAMETYNLQVGIATGSSIAYTVRMNELADALAKGKISQEEYVNEVMRLSSMDLSVIDRITEAMIKQGDIAGAQAFANTIGTEKGMEDFESGYNKLDVLFGQLGLGGEEEDQSATLGASLGIGNLAQDMDTATGEMTESLNDFKQSAEEIGDNLTDEYQDYFNSMSKSAENYNKGAITGFGQTSVAFLEDMKEFDSTLDYVFSKQRQVTFTMTQSSMVSSGTGVEVGDVKVPQFAEGGFTGYGTQPFLAQLHPNEVVIPLDKVKDSGSSGEGKLSMDVYIDGRQVEASVSNVKRLRNE